MRTPDGVRPYLWGLELGREYGTRLTPKQGEHFHEFVGRGEDAVSEAMKHFPHVGALDGASEEAMAEWAQGVFDGVSSAWYEATHGDSWNDWEW